MGLFENGRNYFASTVSENKKHIVIYDTETSGRNLTVSFYWIDDSMNVVSRTTAGFKGDNNIAAGEGMVDNEGNFFISAYTPIGAKNFADRVWMLRLKQGERKFVETEMPLNDKYAA